MVSERYPGMRTRGGRKTRETEEGMNGLSCLGGIRNADTEAMATVSGGRIAGEEKNRHFFREQSFSIPAGDGISEEDMPGWRCTEAEFPPSGLSRSAAAE
jgi:hypothetical protein